MEHYRIVKIIDEYKVVINAGSEQSIKKRDKLEIFIPGEEVFDPITNESLGTLDTIKAYLNVVDVFSKMSICQNADTRNVSSFAPALTQIAQLGSLIAQAETKPLNVDSTEISGGLSEEDKKIRIGDLVRKSPD